MQKTNAVRMLEKAKIPFDTAQYEVDEADLSGAAIARKIGADEKCVFKTLVARGEKHGCVVFCIPVSEEVDLKKAAAVCGEKRVELLPLKQLLPTTGYVRGGCSPIGMKKHFPTYIHSSALDLEKIYVSGGARGLQIITEPKLLSDFVGAKYADLILQTKEGI